MKATKSNAAKILEQMRIGGSLVSVRTYNSGGPGGQHSNRTENGVEIIASYNVQMGSEIRVVTVKGSAALKSQHASRATALNVLRSRLYAEVQKIREEQSAAARVTDAGFGGRDRVRTYHQPDDRVVDGAGPRASYRETVGKGKLGDLIDARRKAIEGGAI